MQDDIYVRDISTLRIADAEEAGGKGANIGELVAARLPVPPGFVLLRSCYQHSIRAGGVDVELSVLHREALATVADTSHLAELCEQMQRSGAQGRRRRRRARPGAFRLSRARKPEHADQFVDRTGAARSREDRDGFGGTADSVEDDGLLQP